MVEPGDRQVVDCLDLARARMLDPDGLAKRASAANTEVEALL